MRRNRKVPKKLSVMTTITMRFGAVIVIFFVMVILNLLSSSGYSQLVKEKALKEREIARLEEAKARESTRWEEMRTPERIEAALLRHGLSMKPPRPEQTVVMLDNGRPRPGQYALKKAHGRQSVLASSGDGQASHVPLRTGKTPYRRYRSR